MSILSKPWRVSLQLSPNLCLSSQPTSVQTHKAACMMPCARIGAREKRKDKKKKGPTQTQRKARLNQSSLVIKH